MGIEHSGKGLLIDERLRNRHGQGLTEVLTEWRADGLSWRECARRLTAMTDVRISYMTVADLAAELGVHNYGGDPDENEPKGSAA